MAENAYNAAATAPSTAISSSEQHRQQVLKPEEKAGKSRKDKPEDLCLQYANTQFARIKVTLEPQEYTLKRRKCLEVSIDKKTTPNFGRQDMYTEIGKRTYFYVSNYHFNEWCKKQGFKPYNAATHAAMLGKTAMKNALIDNVIDFGEPKFDFVPQWDEPIFEEKDLPQYQQMVRQYGLPTGSTKAPNPPTTA